MTKHKEINKEVAYLLDIGREAWEINISRKEATYRKNNTVVGLSYYGAGMSVGRIDGISFDLTWRNSKKLGRMIMPKVIESLDESTKRLKGYRLK
jgi:hypothetical protein